KLDYGLGGIESYRWVAAVSARTDAICEELNGQVFPLASSVVPPIHVNCRCSIIPVTELS
ncbi:MAG: minor capsid protein, partial [Proteobacteria bacterium]|nr:minor capsid protein [Pseudomonadota bacterium]